jgi:hypothetical protein
VCISLRFTFIRAACVHKAPWIAGDCSIQITHQD